MSKFIFCVKFSILDTKARHFENIFGLSLQQNQKPYWNFGRTLIWPNLTLFWKKKLIFRYGVAVAAKMVKNGQKIATKWPKMSKQ